MVNQAYPCDSTFIRQIMMMKLGYITLIFQRVKSFVSEMETMETMPSGPLWYILARIIFLCLNKVRFHPLSISISMWSNYHNGKVPVFILKIGVLHYRIPPDYELHPCCA